MKINLAQWERMLRYVLGLLLVFWAAAGGPWWGWVGVYLVMTASWGYCPMFSYFNLRTAPDYDEKREQRELR